MRNYFWAGCLFALTALSACGTNDKSQPTDETNSTASTGQSIVLSTDGAGLVQQVTAKGIIVHLDDQFHNAVLARREADGSVSTECHNEQGTADAFLQGRTAYAHAEEK